MSKFSGKAHPTKTPVQQKGPRLLGGPGGDRLFDPDGIEYERVAWDLPAKEVKRFARRGKTPFAVHECGGGVEWFNPADTAAVWVRIRPDFEDVDDWKPPADAPGAQPYRAAVWKALSGRQQVLLLTDG